MKKILLFMAVFAMSLTALRAQTVSDFENLNLPVDSFWNGSDLSGGFTSGHAFFVNGYDTTWGSWTGFSYSTMRDTLTPGFANMYSSVTGGGYSQSATYAVANPSAFGPAYIGLRGMAKGKEVSGFYITNSTYAYLSMRDGDAYAKKFGGASGNDPDWFRLKISGFLNGQLTDTTEFYLADYRFSDNTQDYIVKDWQWVDLSTLGNVDSLSFELSSSDVGTWGMNTPAFFCMDELQTTDGLGIAGNEGSSEGFSMYPNPVDNQLTIELAEASGTVEIYSLAGQLLTKKEADAQRMTLDLSALHSGVYFVVLTQNNSRLVSKLIKR